ncbi:Salicylate 5-hydroxylase, small oxygenase component [Pigmentiphaga humi]|uniref:Salicylate 5-hydroxylase, small oxygenase component n=1 Tax=Pigmentiphaga humi TaxID=2478468 RepID=A0A3P4B6X7_9BURK|nr:aromatic-ring-hydroxylating dioxygenase subunit beta [Pigmentiphaga humi]VCU70925.1 Salicylate 5-hydroxylase, small oxygenase component [Pigmentiphaga humi]
MQLTRHQADLLELIAFHGSYSACLDQNEFERWPDFFLDDCHYRIQARENHDQGLPLCILWLEGRGMLRDRVYGIRETLYHDPYYQRHVISTPLITASNDDEIVAETNYQVIRTKRDQPSELFNAGRYLDRLQRTPGGLKLKSRTCVFDSEWILNSIIYPL